MPLNEKPIPKIIHFVWVGGPIDPNYLHSIAGVCRVAAQDGYTVNLWVDDEKNFYTSAQKEGIQIPNLKLRDIKSEVLEPMENDPFYQGQDPDFPLGRMPSDAARQFKSYVYRELVGFKNFAAAADLLRYEILRKEGGWYFDTDTYFPDINPPFSPPELPKNIQHDFEKYEKQYSKYLLDCKELNEKSDHAEQLISKAALKKDYKTLQNQFWKVENAFKIYIRQYLQYLEELKKFNEGRYPVLPLPPGEALKSLENLQALQLTYRSALKELKQRFSNPLEPSPPSDVLRCLEDYPYPALQKKFAEVLAAINPVNRMKAGKMTTPAPHFDNRYIPLLGIMINTQVGYSIKYNENSDIIRELIYDPVESNNDIIGVVENNDVMKIALVECIRNYQTADKKIRDPYRSDMDDKRYPFGNRLLKTVAYSGPCLLIAAMTQVWAKTQQEIQASGGSPKEIEQMLIDAFDSFSILRNTFLMEKSSTKKGDPCGLSVIGRSDRSWLKKAEKLRGFDSNSIPSTQFFSNNDSEIDAFEEKLFKVEQSLTKLGGQRVNFYKDRVKAGDGHISEKDPKLTSAEQEALNINKILQMKLQEVALSSQIRLPAQLEESGRDGALIIRTAQTQLMELAKEIDNQQRLLERNFVILRRSKEVKLINKMLRVINKNLRETPNESSKNMLNNIKEHFEAHLNTYLDEFQTEDNIQRKREEFITHCLDSISRDFSANNLQSLSQLQPIAVFFKPLIAPFINVFESVQSMFPKGEEPKKTYRAQFFAQQVEKETAEAAEMFYTELNKLR